MLSIPTKPTLYHTKWWSSSRPLSVLLELGTVGGSSTSSPIEVKTITKEQLKTDPILTKLNPQKRLPFFYDPVLELSLNESGALVQYLLEKYDVQHLLHPRVEDPTFGDFLNLIHFGPATAYHVAVPILFHKMPPEDAEPTPLAVYEEKKRQWHEIVAPTLEQSLDKYGGPFLLGSTFSAADLVCGYDVMTISFTSCADELLDAHPKVRAYLVEIQKRKVYKELYLP